MDVEKFIILILGWLLGLLGPIITDSIKRRRENTMGRAAIASELRALGTTLALAAYIVRTDQGTVDRKFLEWLKSDLERNAISDEDQSVVSSMRTLLALSDDELGEIAKQLASDGAKGSMLQQYRAPLLDSRVSALHSFETSYQRSLLEINRNLALLDDLVDRSRKYFELTFTKLEGENHRLVRENFAQACAEYAKRAEFLVRLIRRLPLA